MTAAQIYAVMLEARFPADKEYSPGVSVAVCLTAIALRESGGPGAVAGNPNAFNGNTVTGDRSYGLLQINLRDVDVDRALLASGLIHGAGGAVDETLLFDPLVNAKAGHLLWSGNNAFIDLLWYVTRPGYREAYESHLPAALAAAQSA